MVRHLIGVIVTYVQDLVWYTLKGQNLNHDHWNSLFHKEAVEVEFSILYMQAHLD